MTPIWVFFISLLAVCAVLGLLARSLQIYPHRPLVLLAILPGLMTLGLFYAPEFWLAVIAVDVVVVLIALADLLTLPKRTAFSAERHHGRIASLKKHHPVTLTISNHTPRDHFVWIRDDVPPGLRPEPATFAVNLTATSRATLKYVLSSLRRGAFVLPRVHVRVRSRFALWQRLFQYPCESQVHVYPDMKQLSEYAILARTNRLSLVGVRRSRRIGQDNEFERLRDFTVDDNFKHIDWRSTARRQKLTVKDFQANQSQRVIFLLDCGRMMTNQASGLSLLDHALNSMLMLSYVALGRGDSVGLLCFSDEIHTYVPPAGGKRQMNRLLHASFDRFPRLVESRYDQAFLYLASHCRKRTLVILITNLIDEVNSNQVQRYLGTIVGRHLPLSVLLRDRRMFDAADVAEPQGPALYRAAAAASILSWRQQVLTDLNAKGVLSLDVFPEDMTAPLVNRYLDIKARHLL